MKKALGWVALLTCAVATGVAMSQRPWNAFREQREEAATAASEMRATEARRAELLREEALIRSPLGTEELARKRGFVKADEQPAN